MPTRRRIPPTDAATLEEMTDLLRGMKEMDKATLQVQATGVAVDGPVRIEDIGNGMTMRSGWRISPGIPN